MLRILVLGDFIQDCLIQKQATPVYSYRDALPATIMTPRPGGAWYLGEILHNLYSKNETAKVFIPDYDELSKANAGLVKSYESWLSVKEGKENRWRADAFLGCEIPKDKALTYQQMIDSIKDLQEIDTLVIEDLGIRFANDTSVIDELLPLAMKVNSILLKTHSHRYDFYLWNVLKDNNLLQKTTVVTTADVLRQGGADISRGLSWDSTLEETATELDSGYYSNVFQEVKRLILLYDSFGVASFTTESQEKRFPGTELNGGKLTFERLVFDTKNYEGAWAGKYAGKTFGTLSLATAVAVMIDSKPQYSLSFLFKAALSAIQAGIAAGGEIEIEFEKRAPWKRLQALFTNPKNDEASKTAFKAASETLSSFSTAYPRYHKELSFGLYKDESGFHSNLLKDAAGEGEEYLFSKALSVVMNGYETVLSSVPMVNYGMYQSFDREEIERINSVNNLIRTYINHPSDNRPLSIAVFGAPGSGKSFAIKNLLKSIFGSANNPITFNLTQMQDTTDLYNAFHIVQDRTVKGALPLIFWDEFDADENKWLKEFLAPMQDGEFNEGSITHPLGRAIFVFAGGTCSSYAEYEDKVKEFKAKKGPDFISRLRGYVNIKGPNTVEKTDDPMFIIRRAMLLRTMLQIHHKHLFNSGKTPAVSPGVVSAFLRTEKFLHGARSLESVVTLSTTDNRQCFTASSLPSESSLAIHVTKDFRAHITKGEMDVDFIEELAEEAHNHWMKEKIEHGYVYGPERCDGEGKKTHPWLMAYPIIPPHAQESNRITARLTRAKLHQLGYELVPNHQTIAGDLKPEEVIEKHLHALLEIEHNIWLRAKMLEGYEYAADTVDSLLLHKDITLIGNLKDSKEINLDKAMLKAAEKILIKKGFMVRKIVVKTEEKP